MHSGKGQVVELMLENGLRLARIACPAELIPAPGQYLLAGYASDSPLPVSLFSTESNAGSFISSPPIPESWIPGTELTLRGPLGRGFSLPDPARKIALVPFDSSSFHLRSLIRPALAQGAAIVLVNDVDWERLPDEVEVQPFSALEDVLEWADYIASDVARESLPGLRERLGVVTQLSGKKEAQALVRTPLPCGGVAECGVCAVTLKSGWKLACRDGPVFDLREIL